MIIKTDAVVLRTRKYGDTSTIATLYTEAFGKMGVIAKGEREQASKGTGALDILSLISAVIYRKEHRDLQLLSRVEHRKTLRRVGEGMDRLAAGMVFLELTDSVTPLEEKNPSLYRLLVNSLLALEGADRNVGTLVLFFETRLLDILGFRPSWSVCVRCARPLGAVEESHAYPFDPHAGGLVCIECRADHALALTLQSGSLKMLQRLQSTDRPAEVLQIAAVPEVSREVGEALSALLASHVVGFKPPKSRAVFASLEELPKTFVS